VCDSSVMLLRRGEKGKVSIKLTPNLTTDNLKGFVSRVRWSGVPLLAGLW
jgi:hypothetical protein